MRQLYLAITDFETNGCFSSLIKSKGDFVSPSIRWSVCQSEVTLSKVVLFGLLLLPINTRLPCLSIKVGVYDMYMCWCYRTKTDFFLWPADKSCKTDTGNCTSATSTRYFLSPVRMKWKDARQFCENGNATLAIIVNESENNRIVEKIRRIKGGCHQKLLSSDFEI